MNHRGVLLFKEKFLEVWTSILVFIQKVCVLLSFISIPVLLVDILYSLHCGHYMTSLIQAIVLVLMIHVNKEL